MEIQPVTLTGSLVCLEPLSQDYRTDLAEAGRDEVIWRYMPYGLITTPERMAAHIDDTLAQQKRGTDLPFAVVHRASGRAIGCTRYLAIERRHRGLEIGGTWYALAHQRSGVNTECKFLLLAHAFEQLGCVRVQLKTDSRNERSQRAMERIGASREGVLRQHMIMPDGYIRDTVMYSIVAAEWPAVKERLRQLMKRSG